MADPFATDAATRDEIYRDKVARARAEAPVAKLLAGFRLFEHGLELTKVDVARMLGTSDESAVQRALQTRFDRVRRMRESGLYWPIVAQATSLERP